MRTLIHRAGPSPSELRGQIFQVLLATLDPGLARRVVCAYSESQAERFTIGRVGARVCIRLGQGALSDPLGAICDAVPDAEALSLGTTTSVRMLSHD